MPLPGYLTVGAEDRFDNFVNQIILVTLAADALNYLQHNRLKNTKRFNFSWIVASLGAFTTNLFTYIRFRSNDVRIPDGAPWIGVRHFNIVENRAHIRSHHKNGIKQIRVRTFRPRQRGTVLMGQSACANYADTLYPDSMRSKAPWRCQTNRLWKQWHPS